MHLQKWKKKKNGNAEAINSVFYSQTVWTWWKSTNKLTFTYSLCNINLIISVIDSLMSAGSVYRKEEKEKKKTFTSEQQLRKIILLSIYTKFNNYPSLRSFTKEKYVCYSDEGSEEERLSGYTWKLMAKCKMQPQFSVVSAAQGAGAALNNSWKSSG